jgi:hypothetical protein
VIASNISCACLRMVQKQLRMRAKTWAPCRMRKQAEISCLVACIHRSGGPASGGGEGAGRYL